jgi:hypothetical protein
MRNFIQHQTHFSGFLLSCLPKENPLIHERKRDKINHPGPRPDPPRRFAGVMVTSIKYSVKKIAYSGTVLEI